MNFAWAFYRKEEILSFLGNHNLLAFSEWLFYFSSGRHCRIYLPGWIRNNSYYSYGTFDLWDRWRFWFAFLFGVAMIN